MALSINTNASAILAISASSNSARDMNSSMERLSSGSRLNSASDDAAGIAIASRLTSDIRGANQAVRNALDGQALIDTAEGAHKEVENILQRMREVSVQSANDTNNQQDRDNLQAEFHALSQEVDRIAATTTWAGQQLVSEPPASISLQVGSGTTESDQINISFASMTASSLGLVTSAGTESSSQQTIAFGGHNLSEISNNHNNAAQIDLGTTSDVDNSLDLSSELQNGLILKSTSDGSGATFAKIEIKEAMLTGLVTHLEELVSLKDSLEVAGTLAEVDIAQGAISEKKVQISAFIGSFYTSGEINITSQMNSNVRNTSIEMVSSLDPNGAPLNNLLAVEVDFGTLFQNVAVSNNSGATGQCSCGASHCDGNHINAFATTTSNAVNGTSAGSSSNSEINTLLMANKWDLSSDGQLTYSYYEEDVPYASSYRTDLGTPKGVSQYGATNAAMLDTAFASWDNIADFDFVKVTEISGSNNIGELRVAYTDRSSGAAAFAIGPGSGVSNGDVYFEIEDTDITGNDFSNTADASYQQSFNYFAAIHEIGHAIGLSHPFDGSSAAGTTLNSSVDNFRKTVMSYVQRDRNMKFTWNDAGQNVSERFLASSPMMLDVEAVQFMYGFENDASQSTDTTLTFAPTNANGTYEKIHTVVDSGGNDIFDASAFSRNSTINLTPGTFSSLGIYSVEDQISDLTTRFGSNNEALFRNTIATYDQQASASNSYYPTIARTALFTGGANVGISAGTLIEKAVGGSGNDTIIGNTLDNYLTGGQGEDTLDGGAGYDVAIYNGAKSEFTITGLGNGSYTVAHSSPSGVSEGTDTLAGIEVARFSSGDGTYQYYDFATQNVAVSSSQELSSSGFPTTSYQPNLPTVGGIVSITSGNDARYALTSIDKAIEAVNTQRSSLGAVSNRLNHTINNLTNISSNLTAARGGIQDADFALETTKLAKNQILQRASTAMLAQANASKQNVLTLLRG